MPSTSDPSVWRSLAVAFGDGLAFGVGMKLTQQGGHRSAVPVPATADISPLAERLAQLEARLDGMDRTPVPAAAGNLDQHVLEAVIHALEARLTETVGQVDRRLAEMEARFALELKSMDKRVELVAEGAQRSIAELKPAVAGVLEAAERRTAERVSVLDNAIAKLQNVLPETVRREVESRIAGFETRLREEIRAASEQAFEMARQTAQARLDERLEEQVGPLLIHASRQEQTLEELRRRSEQSDRTVLELLAGIGRLCHEAARKLQTEEEVPAPPDANSGGAVEMPAAEVPEPPPLDLAPPLAATEDEEPLPGVALEPMLAEAESQASLPVFAQVKKPGRVWRIPLVSSLVVGTVGLALLHWL